MSNVLYKTFLEYIVSRSMLQKKLVICCWLPKPLSSHAVLFSWPIKPLDCYTDCDVITIQTYRIVLTCRQINIVLVWYVQPVNCSVCPTATTSIEASTKRCCTHSLTFAPDWTWPVAWARPMLWSAAAWWARGAAGRSWRCRGCRSGCPPWLGHAGADCTWGSGGGAWGTRYLLAVGRSCFSSLAAAAAASARSLEIGRRTAPCRDRPVPAIAGKLPISFPHTPFT